MPVKSTITDPANNLTAHVVSGDEFHALAVASRPLKLFTQGNLFFSNNTHGINMNIDASASGTPDQVHNGLDSTLWTASTVAGTWIFNSAAQANSPTQSIDATSTVNNDIAQFAKGSELTVLGFQAFSGWIYITGWSLTGIKEVNFYCWDVDTGTQQGDKINLANYVNIGNTGVWQQFIVPMSDFNITELTIDSIRVETIDIGGGPPPNYYLDDLQFEEAGAGEIFKVAPVQGTWAHPRLIKLSIAGPLAGTVTNGTMPGLSYDQLLGVTSSIGLAYQRTSGGIIQTSAQIAGIDDWLQFSASKLEYSVSDGTNTLIGLTFVFFGNNPLKAENDDTIRFVVSENYSSLLQLKAMLIVEVEQRERVQFSDK